MGEMGSNASITVRVISESPAREVSCLGYQSECEDRVRLLGGLFRRGLSHFFPPEQVSTDALFFFLQIQSIQGQDQVSQVDQRNKAAYCCADVLWWVQRLRKSI